MLGSDPGELHNLLARRPGADGMRLLAERLPDLQQMYVLADGAEKMLGDVVA